MIRRVLVAGLIVMLTGNAFADPIAVKNAGFEEPVLDAGAWSNTYPDWATPPNTGDAFIEHIVGFNSEGNNHIGIQGGQEVSQDLGVPVLPNTTYTLTVGVGRRNANFTVEGNQSTYGLYVGGDLGDGGTLIGDKAYDAFPLADLTFVDDSLSVTTGGTVPTGNLFISLRTAGPERAHFDNIRLDAVPIPEPSSLALAMLGLLGLAHGIRRR